MGSEVVRNTYRLGTTVRGNGNAANEPENTAVLACKSLVRAKCNHASQIRYFSTIGIDGLTSKSRDIVDKSRSAHACPLWAQHAMVLIPCGIELRTTKSSSFGRYSRER